MTGIEKKLMLKNGKEEELRACEINQKVRQKYSLSDELAILRQRDTKPEEFAEYNDYVERCKVEVAKEISEA